MTPLSLPIIFYELLAEALQISVEFAAVDSDEENRAYQSASFRKLVDSGLFSKHIDGGGTLAHDFQLGRKTID